MLENLALGIFVFLVILYLAKITTHFKYIHKLKNIEYKGMINAYLNLSFFEKFQSFFIIPIINKSEEIETASLKRKVNLILALFLLLLFTLILLLTILS